MKKIVASIVLFSLALTGIAFAAGPHYYEFLVPGTSSLTSFDITDAFYAKNDGE